MRRITLQKFQFPPIICHAHYTWLPTPLENIIRGCLSLLPNNERRGDIFLNADRVKSHLHESRLRVEWQPHIWPLILHGHADGIDKDLYCVNELLIIRVLFYRNGTTSSLTSPSDTPTSASLPTTAPNAEESVRIINLLINVLC